MDCVRGRELVSVDLDGEATVEERAALAVHLSWCGDCRRYLAAARQVQRRWRVAVAPEVPDLTGAILGDGDDGGDTETGPERGAAAQPVWWRPQRAPARPGARRELALRFALGALGAVQLLIAGPELITHADGNEDLHAVHHLNAWAAAFAVGLLVAAYQPWRVRGLLPLAAALGAVMAATVGLDVVNHHAVAMPATAHVVEIAGLALMWALSRGQAAGGGGPARRRMRLRRDPAGGRGAGPWLVPGSRSRGVASARALDEVA